MLDSLLYDLIIFFSFYCTVVYLGAAEKFNMTQWIGTGLVVVGFIMLKAGKL